jgi:OmcA/MtrC family decaheme c-type cytochrome
MTRHSVLTIAAALAATFLLAGCWGSGRSIGTTAPVATPVPTGNLNAQISGVDIPADGRPVVTFALYDENGVAIAPSAFLAGSGASLRFHIARIKSDGFYENYCRNASGLPSFDVSVPAASQFSALGDGRYSYKFATSIDNASQTLGGIVLAGSEGLTHTVAITAARSIVTPTGKTFQQASNPYINFRPDGAAVTATREIVAVSNCNGCHGKLGPHGGTRRDIALCVLCHYNGVLDIKGANATYRSINLRDLIHRIHYGAKLPSTLAVKSVDNSSGGFGIGGDKFSDVKFPLNSGDPTIVNTPIKCVKCHRAGKDAAGRDFGRDVNRFRTNPTPAKCTSCHDAMIFDNGVSSLVLRKNPAGLDNVVVPDTNANVVRHYNYAQRNIDVTGAQADNTAVCSSCHALPQYAGTEFNYGDILSAHTIIEESAYNFFRNEDVVHFRILAVDNVDAVNRAPRVTFKVVYDNGDVVPKSGVANVSNLSLKVGYIKTGEADFSNDLMFDRPGVMTKPGSAMSLQVTGTVSGNPYIPVNLLEDGPDGSYIAFFGKVGAALPPSASSGTGIVTLEGRVGMLGTVTTPRKTLSNATTRFSSDAAQWYFDLATGAHVTDPARMRRQVVDSDKCRNCHQMLRGHSGSRVDVKECVVCHNPNLSDNVDAPRQVSASLGSMIMRIHAGGYATQPYMINHSPADNIYSNARIPRDRRDCLACHIDAVPPTFGIPLPPGLLPVSVARGAVQNDSADDTKIGHTRAMCTACHDNPSFPLPHILLQTTGSASNPTELCANCHATGLVFGPDFAHEAVR